MRIRFVLFILMAVSLMAFVLPRRAEAHAPVVPPIVGPLQARGNLLIDSPGNIVFLRGVHLPGLDVLDPLAGSPDAQNAAALTGPSAGPTLGVIRLRWNMNVVRLPVSVRAWLRDGQQYLDRVAGIVQLANANELAVVIAACEDVRCGSPSANGLPSADTLAFWQAWASRFKDNPRVIFDVFNEPSASNVPGSVPGIRSAANWNFWLRGGIAIGGQRAIGMQEIVDAIRSTGAQQLIAVSAFHDALGFQGLTSEFEVRDANILYEVHPFYDFGVTNAARDASFGTFALHAPVYAGEWGLTLRENGPGCTNLPASPSSVTELVFATIAYFELHGISWAAASFQTGSLVSDFVDFQPTVLDRPWTCGVAADPQPGMGEAVLLWTTGDPAGFGSLRADRIANTAGGPPSPVAPGQLLSIYAEQLGPFPEAFAQFDSQGRVPTELGGTRVLFDGVPAPVLFAGPFQINVQVPYNLVPGRTTIMQAFFRGVPSNRVKMDVVEAAAEIFQDFATQFSIALNEDGSRNGPNNPAALGSVVVLFGSGGGQTSPPGTTGVPASFPHPTLNASVALAVDSQQATVLFAGEVPGYTGLLQINARLAPPGGTARVRRAVPVSLTVGLRTSRSPVFLWVF